MGGERGWSSPVPCLLLMKQASETGRERAGRKGSDSLRLIEMNLTTFFFQMKVLPIVIVFLLSIRMEMGCMLFPYSFFILF